MKQGQAIKIYVAVAYLGRCLIPSQCMTLGPSKNPIIFTEPTSPLHLACFSQVLGLFQVIHTEFNMSKHFTLEDISAHNSKENLYLAIHNEVYDCSSWYDHHP